MNNLLLLPLAVAIASAATTYLVSSAKLNRIAPTLTSAVIFLSGITLIHSHYPYEVALGGVLRVDPLSAWMLTTVGAVGLTAIGAGLDSNVSREYSGLLNGFIFAMSLAVEADNIGVMWFAIEATTVATAFLVSKSGTRKSAEAAWKYVVIASSGIAIALLGVVIIFGASGGKTLSWILLIHDHQLNQGLLRLGIALTVLGFSTKVGLFPMHSWLPDAHSQSPSPVSALMSGVLLSVALYAILRMRLLSEVGMASAEIKGILIAMGLASVALASLMMVRQRDIKRLLAYSSMEHMGVMALGVAIGKGATAAVLIYILAHGLIKSSLFILVGRVVNKTGTSDITEISLSGSFAGVTKYLTIIAMIGLLGLPPFAIFFAEIQISVAGFTSGLGAYIATAFIFALVAFSSIIRLIANLAFDVAINGVNKTPIVENHPFTEVLVVQRSTNSGPEAIESSPALLPPAAKSTTSHSPHLSNFLIVLSLVGATVFPLFSQASLNAIQFTISTITGGRS